MSAKKIAIFGTRAAIMHERVVKLRKALDKLAHEVVLLPTPKVLTSFTKWRKLEFDWCLFVAEEGQTKSKAEEWNAVFSQMQKKPLFASWTFADLDSEFKTTFRPDFCFDSEDRMGEVLESMGLKGGTDIKSEHFLSDVDLNLVELSEKISEEQVSGLNTSAFLQEPESLSMVSGNVSPDHELEFEVRNSEPVVSDDDGASESEASLEPEVSESKDLNSDPDFVFEAEDQGASSSAESKDLGGFEDASTAAGDIDLSGFTNIAELTSPDQAEEKGSEDMGEIDLLEQEPDDVLQAPAPKNEKTDEFDLLEDVPAKSSATEKPLSQEQSQEPIFEGVDLPSEESGANPLDASNEVTFFGEEEALDSDPAEAGSLFGEQADSNADESESLFGADSGEEAVEAGTLLGEDSEGDSPAFAGADDGMSFLADVDKELKASSSEGLFSDLNDDGEESAEVEGALVESETSESENLFESKTNAASNHNELTIGDAEVASEDEISQILSVGPRKNSPSAESQAPKPALSEIDSPQNDASDPPSIDASLQQSAGTKLKADQEKRHETLSRSFNAAASVAENNEFSMAEMGSQVSHIAENAPEEVKVIKRYAALKEREARERNASLVAMKNEFEKLRQKLLRSEEERRRLTLSSEDMRAQLRASQDKIDESKHQVGKLEQGLQEQIKDLQARLESSEFQAAKSERRLEEFRDRVRNDIQRIRVRERELSNRLELQKRDAEALLGTKDERLLQQKREIDRLQFENDSLRERLEEEIERSDERNKKLSRALQSLKLAQGMLSGLDELDGSSGGDSEAA